MRMKKEEEKILRKKEENIRNKNYIERCMMNEKYVVKLRFHRWHSRKSW